MIAHLQGKVLMKDPGSVIVDAGGVGYEAFIPLSTFYALPEAGQTVSLFIHTHLRENILKLFGFLTEKEKQVFEILIGINKVGPKLALSILSGMSVPDLMQVVSANDVGRLSAIPGVGRKTAERLALELRDKLGSSLPEETGGSPVASPLFDDALSALLNLGYKKNDAEKVLNKILNGGGAPDSLESAIKESLKHLS